MLGLGRNAVNRVPVPTENHESTKFGDIPEVVSIWSGSALKSPATSCGCEKLLAHPLKSRIELYRDCASLVHPPVWRCMPNTCTVVPLTLMAARRPTRAAVQQSGYGNSVELE